MNIGSSPKFRELMEVIERHLSDSRHIKIHFSNMNDY